MNIYPASVNKRSLLTFPFNAFISGRKLIKAEHDVRRLNEALEQEITGGIARLEVVNGEMESEREKHFQKVIDNEILFRKAERLAHFGIWETDLLTAITTCSDEIFTIFGYNRDEIEITFENFLNTVDSADRQRIENLITGAICSVNSDSMEYKVHNKKGEIRYLRTGITIERNAKGEALKLIGFIQDITEEMEAKHERDKIVANILKRNNALEQFTYIVSHNFRAPVANIIGLTGMLLNENTKEEESEIISALHTSSERLDGVILDMNRILQIKSDTTDTKEEVSFDALVNEIKKTMEHSIKKEKALIITDFKEVSSIFTLKNFMHGIFYNLISNSLKFHQKDKTPVIKITSYKVNDKTYIAFKDNGKGIELTNKSNKIFGLYRHFHREIAGKGMGLFMVKTLVEVLNGKISVLSSPDKGTEFKIEFEA